MSHDHGGSFASASGRHRRPLALAFGLTAAYMAVEFGAGFVFGSLALLSDAGHMLTDVVGIGMALAAIQLAAGKRKPGQTYGLYRLEVLAALTNALLLFGVAGYVLFEAYGRLTEPPEVPGLPLLLVASIGLAVNIVSFLFLRAGAKESLNVRGAFLEVLSDMLGSLGVIVAGIILITTGWRYADPLIGAAIGVLILPRTWALGREALRILLEIAPKDLDLAEVERRLAGVAGVEAVHDLHVWTLTPGMLAATGHLTIEDGARLGVVLTDARTLLENEYEIHHATLQCEPAGFVEPEKEV